MLIEFCQVAFSSWNSVFSCAANNRPYLPAFNPHIDEAAIAEFALWADIGTHRVIKQDRIGV